MCTFDGNFCYYCHTPFNGKPCYHHFFFPERRFCSIDHMDAYFAEYRQLDRQRDKRLLKIEKYGRFWRVIDGAGNLIVTAVYKKGAQEVVRRLQAA